MSYRRAYNPELCNAVLEWRCAIRRWLWTFVSIKGRAEAVERAVRRGYTRGWHVA
jgi:hypothetical protein